MKKVSIKYSWDELQALVFILKAISECDKRKIKMHYIMCTVAVIQIFYLKIMPKTIIYKPTTTISFDAAIAFAIIYHGQNLLPKIENLHTHNVIRTTVSTLDQAFA
jgi:hypothetical protein